MPKTGKNDWYVWGEWPGIPWFHSCYNFGLALELKKRSGFGLSKFAVDYNNGTQKIYLLKHEWQEGGKWYLQEVIKNPKKLEKDLKKIEQAASSLFKLNKQLFGIKNIHMPASHLPRTTECRKRKFRATQFMSVVRGLRAWLEVYHELNHRLWSSGMVPNLLELNQAYLSSYLKNYIEKENKKLSQDDWQTLITPIEQSSAQIEEQEFLKIVSENQGNKNLIKKLKLCGENLEQIKNLILKSPKIYNVLKNHHKEFRWIQYGWIGPALSLDYYLDIFARILKQKNAKSLLAKNIDANNQLKQKQAKLEKSLILDKKHQNLLELLRQLLFSKTYRMDALYMGYCAIEPILRMTAKNLKLSMNQLYALYCGWIVDILKSKKLNIDELNVSLKYSAFILEGKKLNFYVGKKAHQKMAKILSVLPKEKKVDTLKGECAFPGKVRARVKIISNVKEADKFEKGDVLVSYATDPSFLPIMKKASAFVTNMGGLTCHAAIVAREMKKPCVVGTKIATHVLKDGDMVEVDAGSGIVKIIK